MAQINANGIDIYYEIAGEGEPLALIMGLGSGHQMWDDNVPGLSEHYTVLSFDNRGVGLTDKPRDEYSIRVMADDTAALLKALDMAPAHVVGASMGGAIGQMLAIHYPETVRGLVLVCTWARRDPYFNRVLETWELIANRISVSEMNRTNIVWGLTPEFFEEHYGEIDRVISLEQEGEQPADAYMGQNRACQAFESIERLGEIRAPTLVLVGDRDILTPVRFSREIDARIPESQLMIAPGMPHAMMWEDPAEFNRICLEFLKDI